MAMAQAQTGRVFIIDDDTGVREMLRLVLETNGFRVQTAVDGMDGLHQLRTMVFRPALILLDLNMPIMTGWEFRYQQQQDPRIASIPVVIISADRSVGKQPFTIDAVDYFCKPLDLNRLLAVVRQVCQRA